MKKVSDKRDVVVASDRLYKSVRKVIQEAQGVVSLRSELSWRNI